MKFAQIQHLLPLIFAMAVPFSTSASEHTPGALFEGLTTPTFEVTRWGKDADFLGPKPNQNQMIDWVPTAEPTLHVSKACRPRQLESALSQSRDHVEFSAKLNSYLAKCESELRVPGASSLISLIRFYSTKYKFHQNSYMRRVLLTLEGGKKVYGVLALKPGRRPLVIAKCGLFCNANADPGLRMAFSHLFDESPFHVLAVGNITGSQQSILSQEMLVGGFEEGQDIWRIAQLLRQHPKLNSNISSIHVMGQSLGGHGALYSAIYASHNDPQPLIQSVMALCPVSDLQVGIDTIFQGSPRGLIFQGITWDHIKSLFGRLPMIDELLPDRKKPKLKEIPELLTRAALKSYENRDYPNGLAPFENRNIRDQEDLFQLNQFLNYSRWVEVPTLIWSSENDPVVLADLHFSPLQKKHRKEQGPLQFIRTPKGSHCAIDAAYSWELVTKSLRSFVLNHSPEFRKSQKDSQRPLKELANKTLTLWGRERHISQSIAIEPHSHVFDISFKIFSPYLRDGRCRQEEPLKANDQCYRASNLSIPFAAVQSPWFSPPTNATEAQALTRWANANLKLVDRHGDDLVNSNQREIYLAWSFFASSLTF